MSTKARSLILDPGAHNTRKGEGDGLLPAVPRAGAEPAAQPLPAGQRCAVRRPAGAWCCLPP